jgi:lysophospholipase
MDANGAPARDRARETKSEAAPLFRVEGGPPVPEGVAEWFVARSGRKLRVARFAPAGTPRGSVVLSTGRTEQIEKYGEVIGELVARDFVVLAHDWAGHGLSTRFATDPLVCDVLGGSAALVADFEELLTAYARELPGRWLAVAHSMGAALTLLALSGGEERFAGAALSAPMIAFSVGKLPFWFIRLVVELTARATGETRLARAQADPAELAFEPNLLTHDRARFEKTRKLYRAHPELKLGEPTWRWLRFAVEIREQLVAPGAAERIRCPLVAVAAGADRIVDSAAIRSFVARVPRGRCIEVADSFHEVLMETDDRRARFWQAFDELAGQVLAT